MTATSVVRIARSGTPLASAADQSAALRVCPGGRSSAPSGRVTVQGGVAGWSGSAIGPSFVMCTACQSEGCGTGRYGLSAARCGGAGGLPISSIIPSTTRRSSAITSTTTPVGLLQKMKINPAAATAAIRSTVRYLYTHVPKGPVLMPARSPVPLIAANADLTAPLVLTAVTDGPVKNPASATTRPSTSSTRSPCLMNLTIVS